MIQVRAYCKGVRRKPLLMNKATDEVLESQRTGVSLPKKRDWTREEEAASKLYRDEGGRIGFPGDNLFSCMVAAGRYVQLKGKTNISTVKSTLLPSFLDIVEDFLPLENGGGPVEWKPLMVRGVNPNGGEMVAICRPAFKDWGFWVTFEVDESLITLGKILELLKAAGSKVGMGDWRPARKGRCGRFIVEKFQVMENGQWVDWRGKEKAVAAVVDGGEGEDEELEEEVAVAPKKRGGRSSRATLAGIIFFIGSGFTYLGKVLG